MPHSDPSHLAQPGPGPAPGPVDGDLNRQETAERALERMARTVENLSGRLKGLLKDREQDFLALGERFMDFSSRSRRLVEQASELAGLTSGGEIEQGVRELSEEMREMEKVGDLSANEANLSEIEAVGRIILGLEAGVQNFKRIVRSLQMLGVSTRIESVRLGADGMGFATLADDVDKLAGKIVDDSRLILDKSKSMSGLTLSARRRTRQLIEAQRDCSRRIITDTDKNIKALEDMTHRSREAAQGLDARTRTISSSISEAVASLQFHDIIRQQVEHVEQALSDMREVARQGSGPAGENGDGRPLSETIYWLADASRLQASQIDNAGERFEKAVETLRRSLLGISGSVLDMSGEIEAVLENGDRTKGSVLDRIESDAESAVSAMKEFALHAGEIGAIVADLAGTVKEMNAFVLEIEEVGTEIELIALNASVKAARAGDRGRALGVLATAIKGLSAEAREQTGAVAESLRNITRSSKVLEDNSSRLMDLGRIEALAQGRRALMKRIRAINNAAGDMFLGLRREGEDLGLEISGVAEAVDLRSAIRPGLYEVKTDLEDVARVAHEAMPAELDENRSERLEELLSRYTMDMERVVHESALQGGGAGDEVELFDAPGQGPEPGPDQGQEWDNVELF